MTNTNFIAIINFKKALESSFKNSKIVFWKLDFSNSSKLTTETSFKGQLDTTTDYISSINHTSQANICYDLMHQDSRE